jgi:hypothetical protein
MRLFAACFNVSKEALFDVPAATWYKREDTKRADFRAAKDALMWR